MKLMDAIALQGYCFQAPIDIRKSNEGIQWNLLKFVIRKEERVDLTIDHIVENLIELLILKSSSN
jgi:hypothetical protein